MKRKLVFAMTEIGQTSFW